MLADKLGVLQKHGVSLLLLGRGPIAWSGATVVQSDRTQQAPHLTKLGRVQDVAAPWQLGMRRENVGEPSLREMDPLFHSPLPVPVNDIPVWPVEVARGSKLHV